jgi:tetratricopeptide (TPR) repeat protein
MGKKSRHKKTNNGGPPREQGLAAAVVPSAATPAAPAAAASASTTYFTIGQLMVADTFEEVLKVKSNYRHLGTFSDDPYEDAFVLHAFGRANCVRSTQDEACLNRAIDYFERAKARIDTTANDQPQYEKQYLRIGMNLALLYSDGRDMEKAISSHRWFLANCSRHGVTASYVNTISGDFNRFEKFEYAIEVLEGSMEIMETLEEKVKAETKLIDAYIGCGKFLKAKSANEKHRSTDIHDWLAGRQSGRIEEGRCNYKAAITHFREVVTELQKEEYDDSLSRTRLACSLNLARTLLRHSTANEAEAFAIF